MRALLGLVILVAGCSTTDGPVTPTLDTARAYGETFPVFPTYADGVASGEALVELVRGEIVVQSGTIDEEEVRYAAADDISPRTWDSFICADGNHRVHAVK
jgi:hypothetical protein